MTLSSSFGVNDSPIAAFNESWVCCSASWRGGCGRSSGIDSVSALGFGLDRFRGPIKQNARAKKRYLDLLASEIFT